MSPIIAKTLDKMLWDGEAAGLIGRDHPLWLMTREHRMKVYQAVDLLMNLRG